MAKAVEVLRLNQAERSAWTNAVKEKCTNVVAQLQDEHAGVAPAHRRCRWDDALAGDGAVWGRVSALHYMDYADARALAAAGLREGKSPAGEDVTLKDGVAMPRSQVDWFSQLEPAPWPDISESLRNIFVNQLGFHEIAPWEDISFEKVMPTGERLRSNLGRLPKGFGFNYALAVVPDRGNPFQFSYERMTGIGVGAWNRVSRENLGKSVVTLLELSSRLVSILMECSAPRV